MPLPALTLQQTSSKEEAAPEEPPGPSPRDRLTGDAKLQDVVDMLRDVRRKHTLAMDALEYVVAKLDTRTTAKFGGSRQARSEVHPTLALETGNAPRQESGSTHFQDLWSPRESAYELKPAFDNTAVPVPAAPSAAALVSQENENGKEGEKSKGGSRVSSWMPEFLKDSAKVGLIESSQWEELTLTQKLGVLAGRILAWRRFEYCMGFLIMLNSISIGMEIQIKGPPGEDSQENGLLRALEVFEWFCLAVYSLELCIRLFARGWENFKDWWFLFDLALVVTGVVSTVIQAVIASQEGEGGNLQFLQNILVFRACRLLRLFRALRMVQQFRSIWRLVFGLLTSFNTMMSTLFLVGLVLYIFACLGVELITNDKDIRDHESLGQIVEANFYDLFVTLLFLVQFISLDSVASVYVPLIKFKPELAIYFLALLLVVSISLMNLVMAKIVEGALDAAHKDSEVEREQRKEKIREILPRLMQIFETLDADSSGLVELAELEGVQDQSEMPQELAELIKIDSMRELFEILDVDQSGEVSQDEFIDGILQMHISEVPVQQMQMLKLLRNLRDRFDKLDEKVKWQDSPTLRTPRSGSVKAPSPRGPRKRSLVIKEKKTGALESTGSSSTRCAGLVPRGVKGRASQV